MMVTFEKVIIHNLSEICIGVKFYYDKVFKRKAVISFRG